MCCFFNLYNFSSKNYLPVSDSLAELSDMLSELSAMRRGEMTSN